MFVVQMKLVAGPAFEPAGSDLQQTCNRLRETPQNLVATCRDFRRVALQKSALSAQLAYVDIVGVAGSIPAAPTITT